MSYLLKTLFTFKGHTAGFKWPGTFDSMVPNFLYLSLDLNLTADFIFTPVAMIIGKTPL